MDKIVPGNLQIFVLFSGTVTAGVHTFICVVKFRADHGLVAKKTSLKGYPFAGDFP